MLEGHSEPPGGALHAALMSEMVGSTDEYAATLHRQLSPKGLVATLIASPVNGRPRATRSDHPWAPGYFEAGTGTAALDHRGGGKAATLVGLHPGHQPHRQVPIKL